MVGQRATPGELPPPPGPSVSPSLVSAPPQSAPRPLISPNEASPVSPPLVSDPPQSAPRPL